MMKFLRRHWYDIGGIVAILAGIVLFISWKQMDVLSILLLANFIGLLVHQYEEYGFPGGGPAINNWLRDPNKTALDRYPLNQLNAVVGNAAGAYLLYLIPVFFPHMIWLGLAPIIVGLFQFFGHGIVMNRKMKSWYNPGLAAVLLFHVPIGCYYLYYIVSQKLVSPSDWGLSILFLVVFMVPVQIISYRKLVSKASPYPFDAVEMNRFNVLEKINRLETK